MYRKYFAEALIQVGGNFELFSDNFENGTAVGVLSDLLGLWSKWRRGSLAQNIVSRSTGQHNNAAARQSPTVDEN